jgi:uncharacterized protein YndB with AHSA1/START domain
MHIPIGLALATLAALAATPMLFARQAEPPPAAIAHEQLPPIVHEGIVEAPVAEVWKVFTTGEGFRALGPAKADVDLRIGGLIRAHYNPEGTLGDQGTIHNQILAYEPERMLTIRIHQPPAGFPFGQVYKDTWTVLTFNAAGESRTHVRIAMLGFTQDEQSRAMRDFFETGNAWTLKTLQSGFSAEKAPPVQAAHGAAATALSPIHTEVIVNAPREDVWRAYTTAQGWNEFFGSEAKVGALPGEPFEIYFDPSAPAGERGSETCTILSLIPGEMFSYTWNAPPQFAHARPLHTWVVVRFESLSATTTKVTAAHHGFEQRAEANPDHAEEWKQVRAYFAQAWPYVLRYLKNHFEEP